MNRLFERRPPPPSREELLQRQREREERIAGEYQFPWTRLLVGGIGAMVAIALTGGGAVSLIVAILVVILALRTRFKPPKAPTPPGRR